MARRVLPKTSTAGFGATVLLEGEIAFDTTLDALRIGDGVTPGGIIARPAVVVSSKAELAAVPAARRTIAYLSLAGSESVWVWKATDHSVQVAGDGSQISYVAPDNDASGASGAWVRLVDATGAGGSSSGIFEADIMPVDRMLPERLPSRKARVRAAGMSADASKLAIAAGIDMGRWNRWGQSENLASAYYDVLLLAKDTETVVYDGVTLTRATTSNFYGSVSSNVVGLGLTPFTTGNYYLVSCYVMDANAYDGVPLGEGGFYMRELANTGSLGQGRKLATPMPRRVWKLVRATANNAVDGGADPTVALGSGAGGRVHWFFSAQNQPDERAIYIGGFQIEDLGATLYKDGIALIGDSTDAGASNKQDLVTTTEFSDYLAMFLNVPVCNRAVGGERLDQMQARWAADMTPLAATCRYAMIGGAVNDIAQGADLATVQTRLQALYDLAVADGFIPVVKNCTPALIIGADAAKEAVRVAYNRWLRETFPFVIDAASVVADPANVATLRSDADWQGDGTHFTDRAKRALGAFAASLDFWEFRTPAPYQANLGAQTAFSGPAALVSGDAGKILGQRKTGWALPTGTLSRATFDPATVTLADLAQRVAAMLTDLHADGGQHGLIGP